MRNGELLLGTGEAMFNGVTQVNMDDVSRNRNRNIIPRFFTAQVKCPDGFREVEYLELLIPGDNKSSPVHLVDDRLREMYRPHYEAFKEGRQLPTDGTPVEHWLGANDSRVFMLKSLHLRTVESVAAMTDQVIASIGMGGRELKERAKAFLEVQKQSGSADALAAKDMEIEELKRRLSALENGDKIEESETGMSLDELSERPPEGATLVTTQRGHGNQVNKTPKKRR